MDKIPFIVLVSVNGYNDPRKVCEHIENIHCPVSQDSKENPIVDLIHYLENEVNDFKYVKGEVIIYSLTDFMDECNDERINLDHWFISYVYITF